MADSKVLLVGPFPDWDTIAREAAGRRWSVERAGSAAEAFQSLQKEPPIAVVLPVQLQDGPAENLVLRARSAGTRADFVVVAEESQGTHERAALLADGVDEVLEGPVDAERVLAKLDRLRDRRHLIDDLDVVVRDPAMLELFERILRVAPLKVTALITGESGTGKEMLAQAIHRASDRRDGPFVAVNIGALPENLLESELFGHEKGAFTSADAQRVGRFELADKGTLFLDEIGEMSLPSQVNLLRILEDEQFLRVGGSRKISVDVRVVAATNRDLEQMVREGKFRRDLYYRLKVVELHVPPLRERRGEIPVLLRELAASAARKHGITFAGFSKEAIDLLAAYEWPGNVRELRNLVDGLVALRPESPIQPSDLPAYVIRGHADSRPLPALARDPQVVEREFVIQSLLALRAEVAALRELLLSGNSRPVASPPAYGGGWDPEGAVYPSRPVRVEETEGAPVALADLERRAIERALRRSGGNRREAARALGMSERTLYRRIKQFGLAGEPDSS